jgi:hypothetical protein
VGQEQVLELELLGEAGETLADATPLGLGVVHVLVGHELELVPVVDDGVGDRQGVQRRDVQGAVVGP